MASKVNPAAFPHVLQHNSNSHLLVIQPNDAKSLSGLALKRLNGIHLSRRPGKAMLTRCRWLRDGQELGCLAALKMIICAQKHRKSRNIRRNSIVEYLRLVLCTIETGGMDREKNERCI